MKRWRYEWDPRPPTVRERIVWGVWLVAFASAMANYYAGWRLFRGYDNWAFGGLFLVAFFLLSRMPGVRRCDRIPDDIQKQLPLADIQKVRFFKRDELTADLICCEVEIGGRVWFFHEEAEGWDALVRHLEQLPGFRADWYQTVVQPPFAPNETIAYIRS